MRLFSLISAGALPSALLGAQAPAVRDPLPVPHIPGYRTLKGDFHLHMVFSDGNVWPTVPVQEAWRDGLDVIALSEHAEYQPHSQDVVDLPPERVTVLRPSGFAGAPAGESRIGLRFEVLNLHTAPGRNLEITMPLTVRND